MKKEIADKWAAELDSGRYVQGRGRLKFVDSDGTVRHCCLGVLCEMAVKDGAVKVAGPFTHTIDNVETNDYKFFSEVDDDGNPYGHIGALPDAVRKWAGLKSTLGGVNTSEMGGSLSAMNDTGRSFHEIAEAIRTFKEDL